MPSRSPVIDTNTDYFSAREYFHVPDPFAAVGNAAQAMVAATLAPVMALTASISAAAMRESGIEKFSPGVLAEKLSPVYKIAAFNTALDAAFSVEDGAARLTRPSAAQQRLVRSDRPKWSTGFSISKQQLEFLQIHDRAPTIHHYRTDTHVTNNLTILGDVNSSNVAAGRGNTQSITNGFDLQQAHLLVAQLQSATPHLGLTDVDRAAFTFDITRLAAALNTVNPDPAAARPVLSRILARLGGLTSHPIVPGLLALASSVLNTTIG